MAELSGSIVAASVETSVNHHAAGESATYADIQQIPHVRVLRLAMPDFREGRTTCRVIYDHGQLCHTFQAFHHGKVAPGQYHRHHESTVLAIHQTGKANASSGNFHELTVLLI